MSGLLLFFSHSGKDLATMYPTYSFSPKVRPMRGMRWDLSNSSGDWTRIQLFFRYDVLRDPSHSLRTAPLTCDFQSPSWWLSSFQLLCCCRWCWLTSTLLLLLLVSIVGDKCNLQYKIRSVTDEQHSKHFSPTTRFSNAKLP